jgi:hypothetical protein
MKEQILSDQANWTTTEVSALEKFALRWSVMAAWAKQLDDRFVALPPQVGKKLEESRIKLAAGCFSSCEVGCVLSEVEGALVTADSSAAKNTVDFWLDLLGHAMSDTVDAERLLRMPAIKIQYQTCGFGSCKCGN